MYCGRPPPSQAVKGGGRPLRRRLLFCLYCPLGNLFGTAIFVGDASPPNRRFTVARRRSRPGAVVRTRGFTRYSLPVTLVVRDPALSWCQRQGTASIGRYFARSMVLCRAVLAVLGAASTSPRTRIFLWALSPHYALRGSLIAHTTFRPFPSGIRPSIVRLS